MRGPALLLALLLSACAGSELAEGWHESPLGDGPRVRWDLEAEPLPEIPLPNDVATWPDPSSPTGLRINASLIASTGMESRLREKFSRLDGWGTFAPITIPFEAPLDVMDMIERQGRGRFSARDFRRHAIYLIDLETGVPVPLDVNSGLVPNSVARPDQYYVNDPRADGSNLLFETVDEDVNGNGVLDPGEDTDFDGVLDRPNTFDGRLTGEPLETYDRMLWFYERETHTLFLRPLLPLQQRRRYAVVLTDRLRGENGSSVRSPFPSVHHLSQREDLASLPSLLRERPHIYGDLAERGWEGVAFAFSFTTQSTTTELTSLREGLYGRGPFAWLAEEFPARMIPSPVRGGVRGSPCETGPRIYTARPDEIREAFEGLPVDDLGIPDGLLDTVLDTLEENVSHLAFGFFESPFLLGDPDAEDVNDTWEIDVRTGEARVERELVPMFIVIPKETDAHRQPFPTTLYAHGYGSLNLEAIAFAGRVARHGIATVAMTAHSHGLPLDANLRPLISSVLGQSCLGPLGQALARDRSRDLDGDGNPDPASLFFSAYMFHTRDAIRQSALDILMGLRVIRAFGEPPGGGEAPRWVPGEIPVEGRTGPLVFTGDVTGDGEVELAGDFDGDGVPDLGGFDAPYFQWGSSLGGLLSMIVAGVEPAVVAAAPVSGAAGLFDVGRRTEMGDARDPIWLRTMGPILASTPSPGPSRDSGCEAGQRSIHFEVPDLADRTRLEVTCLGADALVEGDAVVLRNHANGEVRCAGVLADGRFRVAVPSDEGDRLTLEVYDAGLLAMEYGECRFRGEPRPLRGTVDAWGSENGRAGPGRCPNCARYQQRVYEVGEPLVAPVEGLGLRRQSPELRRLAALAQIAVDRGDPINYARHVFLEPARLRDVPERTRSVLVLNTVGDTTVPTAVGSAYARAAGVLPFLPADAPDELADWRAPESFEAEFGAPTPDDVLIDTFTHEGIANLRRVGPEGAERILFDVDDIADGRLFFDARGRQVEPGGETPTFQPPRLSRPLRFARESRPFDGSGADLWRGTGPFDGHSAILHAYGEPFGQHVILPTDPDDAFDVGAYYIELVGWYLASRGRELLYLERPDEHHCLERAECAYEE